MKHAEAAQVLVNAVAFLGPLAQLAEAANQAATAEQFLQTAKPDVTRLQSQVDSARDALTSIQTQITVARQSLDDLYQNGAGDVHQRVRDVETSLSAQLDQARQAYNKALTGLSTELADLERKVATLRDTKAKLEADVEIRKQRVSDLEGDLATIAVKAGGHIG